MPFQSEKQRRYLWANEPEIARDWTETYGSRIQNNTGGIMRLGFANGLNEELAEENDNEEQEKDIPFWKRLLSMGPISQIMGMFQGPQLTQAQKNMNQQFFQTGNMGQPVGIGTLNNPFMMTSGPFAGMNAPGMSAFGSKDIDQMATKWLNKYGHTAPIEKVHQMSALAGKDTPTPGQNMGMPQSGGWSNVDWGPAEGEFNQGGRVGLAQGNPHLDPGQSQGMSPGEAQARGLGPQHHGSTTSGNLHAGNVGTGEGLGAYQDNIMLGGLGIKPKPKKNWLGMGIAGLKGIGPFLGKKGNVIGGVLSIYDLITKEPDIDDMILSAEEETTDEGTKDEEIGSPTLGSHLLHPDAAKRQIEKDKAMAELYKQMGWTK